MSASFYKKVFGFGLITVLMGGLSACGWMVRDDAPTPYQSFRESMWHSMPDGDGNIYGGYKDEHITGNRYSVTFKGNGVTDRSTVTRYAHRRAKEVCVENGYRDYRMMKNGELHDAVYPNVGVTMPIVTLNFVCVR